MDRDLRPAAAGTVDRDLRLAAALRVAGSTGVLLAAAAATTGALLAPASRAR